MVFTFQDFMFCEGCADTLTLADLAHVVGGIWETIEEEGDGEW